jgi:hypothetical protein
MNYTPGSRARIADISAGIRVDTSVVAALTYLNGAQHEWFTVKGRIWVRQLFIEIISDLGAEAVQLLFNCTFTSPVVAVNAMCAKCASIANAAQGFRVVWLGGAVATAAVITDSKGLSDVIASAGQIVGGKAFVGTIGVLNTDANASQGTVQGSILYTPLSDGAYVAAAI